MKKNPNYRKEKDKISGISDKFKVYLYNGEVVKTYLYLALVLLFIILLASCRDGITQSQIEKNPLREVKQLEKKLAQSGNRFGFTIFNETLKNEKNKNIFIAPLSISYALAMAYDGANGSTREAIQSVLQLQGLSMQDINENYQSLMEYLQSDNTQALFQIANSVWYRTGFSIENAFLENCSKYFNAEIKDLNFSSTDASGIINTWVEKNTNGKIKEIIDKNIDPYTIMFIINAIYFKGTWKYQFRQDKTADDYFYLPDGSKKACKMMSQSAKYSYFENSDFQIIDLPYGSTGFSMTILLPKNANNIDNIISGINEDTWNSWLNSMQTDSVNLFLPKFKMEYDIELNKILTTLGMGIAFTDLADFTNIHKEGGIFISKVQHKTFVEVNEEGTEAAGVTVIKFDNTSYNQNDPKTVYLNHPFIFMIREKYSGSILFAGKIIYPEL
jgi:serine protease inhibitor